MKRNEHLLIHVPRRAVFVGAILTLGTCTVANTGLGLTKHKE